MTLPGYSYWPLSSGDNGTFSGLQPATNLGVVSWVISFHSVMFGLRISSGFRATFSVLLSAASVMMCFPWRCKAITSDPFAVNVTAHVTFSLLRFYGFPLCDSRVWPYFFVCALTIL